MAGMTPISNVMFIAVDDTQWPIPMWWCEEVDGPEWVQRHAADVDRVVEQRMRVASLIAAYSSLLDPNLSQTDAIAQLKRARKALKKAQEDFS